MRTTKTMREIEEREGKPIHDLLADLYEQYGKQTDVARVLGINQGTLSNWLIRLDLMERTVLVPAGGSRRAGERQPEGMTPLPGFEE